MRVISRKFKREEGLTLLELTVVTMILTLLTSIIGLAVSGRSSETRRATQVSDEGTVQRALDRYSGEHPQGRYPTLNGCAPEHILDLVNLKCAIPGEETNPVQVDSNNLEFVFSEAMSARDFNDDGDTDDSFVVAPIIWHKAFNFQVPLSQSEEVKRFLGDFVPREPKHAFEFFGGVDDSWEDGENFDPDELGNITIDPSRITAPAGLIPGSNGIDVRIGQVPIWVIGVFKSNSGVQVKVLLPESRY